MDYASAWICRFMDDYDDSKEHGKGQGVYITVDGAWYIGNFLASLV